MSSTNIIQRSFSTAKKIGKRKAATASSEKSFTLYDACDTCTAAIYEKVVIDDNLRALIITGNPTHEDLEDAKMRLLTEFAELSGDKSTSAIHLRVKNIYAFRSRILGLTMCLTLIHTNWDDKVDQCLSQNGVKAKHTDNKEIVSKRIHSKIKNLKLLMNDELRRYHKLIEGPSQKKTRQDFRKQLAILSKHMGFPVTIAVTLSELAGYIVDFNESKPISNGRPHK